MHSTRTLDDVSLRNRGRRETSMVYEWDARRARRVNALKMISALLAGVIVADVLAGQSSGWRPSLILKDPLMS